MAEERGKIGQPEHAADVRRLIRWAAFLSIGALICHAIDAPGHLTEWWGFSVYFVTAGAFQFFYGFGLLFQPWRYDETGGTRANADRFGRPYYVLGLVLTASVIVLYLITRTTGMPFFGPQAAVKPITILSLVPIVEDIPLVYCLIELLLHTRVHPGRSINNTPIS
jgi:hypothetical protein